jgi:purine-binding chemotaxis protein CheW
MKRRIKYGEPGQAKRRDSKGVAVQATPVELARTFAASRAVEQGAARPGAAPLTSPHSPAAKPAMPQLSLRERVRNRAGLAALLMFRVGQERYAVELLAVEEVIDSPVIHHVPEMPPAMLGVMTARGALTPVYSPHAALGSALADREAVLIFRRGRARVGIVIDDVDDAISVDLRDLRDTQLGDETDAVVLAVVRHAELLVAVVDAEALIAACQSAELLEIA